MPTVSVFSYMICRSFESYNCYIGPVLTCDQNCG